MNSLRHYAKSALAPGAMQKWKITGFPAPQSILDDTSNNSIDLSEDEDAVNRVRPGTPPIHRRKPPKESTPEEIIRHRHVLRKSFPDGWNPPRKISREAMDGVRQLHHYDPNTFTTPVLAEKFKISPEAIRRILKGKWEPSKERKIQMSEKERRSKAEMIKLSRVREAMEAQQAFQAKRDERLQEGKPISGVNTKDRFTFG